VGSEIHSHLEVHISMSNLIAAIEPWIEDSVLKSLRNSSASTEEDASGVSAAESQQRRVIGQIVGQEEKYHVRWLEISDGSHSVWVCPSWDVEKDLPSNIIGSVVRILRWRFHTKQACLERRREQEISSQNGDQRNQITSDSICLYVPGRIETLGGSGLRRVASPMPIEQSIKVKQILQHFRHDWSKIRQQFLGQQSADGAAPLPAPQQKQQQNISSISMGSLNGALKNPSFLKKLQAGIGQVRKAFSTKLKPCEAEGNDESEAPMGSSETIGEEEQKQSEVDSTQREKEAEQSLLATQQFSEDAFEDCYEDEQDMGIESMLIKGSANHGATNETLNAPIGEVLDEGMDAPVDQLATQPRNRIDNTLAAAAGTSAIFDAQEQMQEEENLLLENSPTALNGQTHPDGVEPDDSRFDAQPIPLEDVDENDIQNAYQQAEHTSPSALNRTVVDAAVGEKEGVVAPTLFDDDQRQPPPSPSEEANDATRGSPVSNKRKRNSSRTGNVPSSRIEKILKKAREQNASRVRLLSSKSPEPDSAWRGGPVRKWLMANS